MYKDMLYEGWEVGEDETLLEMPIGTVRSGPAICKRSGKSRNFYLFDFPSWVNVVAETPDNRIVLIRQFRYGTRRVETEIPGGMIDPGEDPVTAGCRELLEETGYVGSDAEIIGKVCPNPAIQNNYCYTVLVRNVVKKEAVHFDEMEDIECYLADVKEISEAVQNGSIDHGLVLNGLMFYRMTIDGGF